MSIPLVQNNEKDSINTSIIAIKRQIERINMLLGLSNSEEIDTSVFATKTELEDAVTQVETELEDAITQVETDLAPVDEVTVGNMQSVTSNAVAEALRSTISELMLIRTPDYWVRYLPPNIIFEQRDVGGKNLQLEFGIYRFNNNWSVEICWGTLDSVIQESTGRGRTGWVTYTQNSTPTRTAYDCNIFVVNMTIPSVSPIIGINSSTFMLIRNLVIT